MSRVQANPGLSGLNLYIDKKNRIIYYNPLVKKAVMIPKSDYRKFNMYRTRYLAVISAFLIMAILFEEWFHWPLWLAFVLSLIIYAGFEFSFYKFVNRLPDAPKFNKESCVHTYDLSIQPKDRTRAKVKIVLYFILGILLVVNAYQMNYDPSMLIMCWIAMICCFAYAGFTIWQLSRSTKVSR
ncbi:hypothetical protein [Ileibacterium valens]|uniref:Uncharacterized protein n=1 Tax=Ileibacterium valens TaxID=1862668 RepID=A0A1U7NE45_9FIRM|nr:hypothetical protein [Ileibacterium valens]OLU37750.1 hypothetical protein BO222_09865 [Ileibacterium valens]OLU42034.1 hypothetical protein BM735_03090 [Erysipelotrichaceae bacterium NYU-BL-F16]OLU43263.1 hypothetical protein BO224_00380 [Erysipelotrichaceae bacterium NYU-BL-E8]